MLLRSVLTNLQFPFEFFCLFIVSECAFLGDEVENLLVVTVVANVSSNQLSILYHASYVWPTLKQKIPLAFNDLVHLFLLS
jgi:nucleoside recognition membrane protein YjiH